MFEKYHLSPMMVTVCVVFSMTLAAMGAMAQAAPPQQPGQPPQLQISDEDLKKAATAHAEITRINQQLQQSIQQAEGIAEVNELQSAADKLMVQSIKDVGLDLETYNDIVQQVQMDEKLREKFMQEMQ